MASFPERVSTAADRDTSAVSGNAAAGERLPVEEVRRASAAEARGSDAGALLQDSRRLQLLPQGAGGRQQGRPVRLRVGRQPRAGLCLRLPPFRQEGRRLHAGDDTAAEDRQDPAVRRRVRRDQADRRLLRRVLSRPRSNSPRRAARTWCRPSTTRTSSRDRRRSPARSPTRCPADALPTWWCCRSAAAGCRPA